MGAALPPSGGGGSGRGPKKGRPERSPAAAERRLRGSRHDHPTSGCRSPGARSLLLPYALSTCRESEAVAFEAHLLACETCFQDLETLDRAGSVIREFTHSPSPELDHLRLVLAARCSRERSTEGRPPCPPSAGATGQGPAAPPV